MSHSIILFAAATALLFAAVHDVAVRTVPNRVSMIVAVAGLGLNALDGQFVSALFGGGLVFAAAWFCWRRGWIGGGDVKLLTACAFLVPPASVPELVLGTAIAGGLLALLYLALARMLPGDAARARRPLDAMFPARPPPDGAMLRPFGIRPFRRPAGLMRRIWRAERRRIRRGLSLPYACAIAAGAALTLCSPVPFG